MKKLKKYKYIVLFSIILIIIIIPLYFLDIGLNSRYFIKKDFNQAFQYRLTGDCSSFLDYTYQDNSEWKTICKYNDVISYKIEQISNKIFSNKAFLQVEIKRSLCGIKENYVYSRNYEMKKDGLKWKINQEISNKEDDYPEIFRNNTFAESLEIKKCRLEKEKLNVQ